MASMNTITPAAAQTPSANTAAVCTLAAPTDGSRWTLFQLSYSYSGTPTGGSLVITWGSVSMTYYIPAGGPGWIGINVV